MRKWIIVIVIVFQVHVPAHGMGFHSVSTLNVICLTPGNYHSNKFRCRSYIQDIVEMLWVVQAITRAQNLQVSSMITICRRAVDQDWDLIVQVVKSNIKNMEPGPAVYGVSKVLNDHFCRTPD